jgi:hypothetical protein
MDIKPINNHVLVELVNEYGDVSTISKQYDTKTSGVIIAVDTEHPEWNDLIGKTGYWEGFKDSNSFTYAEKSLALVKYADIGGIR